jgi:hypothetical protein
MSPDLTCTQVKRREDVRKDKLFGLDYAEVSDDQLTIYVHFLGRAPEKLEQPNIRLQGGRRIRDMQVTGLTVQHQTDTTLDDFMEVTVNKPGDFSTYSLSVLALDNKPFAGFDPRYDQVQFSFKATCPTGLDCKTDHQCPPEDLPHPEINYLAKDYASFRQLLFDRLATTMPNWQETHAPDLGVALVEVLAYAGDYLSYYQDAVATEAYLGTARQRISVRRHARLVDYQMHEGCNARAWITIHTDKQEPLDLAQIYFITRFPKMPNRTMFLASDLESIPPLSYDVFQPLLPSTGTFEVCPAHNEIHFYTWGDCQCCLPKGATSATLIDSWVAPPPPPAGATAAAVSEPKRSLNLHAGDVLIFEEVLGPKTANAADADPKHRQAVRLTRVCGNTDPLYTTKENPAGQPVVNIEWAQEDALRFTLCISTQAPPPACDCLENVTVARGNVILVDNRSSATETLGPVPTDTTTQNCPTACKPSETTVTPGVFRPVLTQHPVTFSQPLPYCGAASKLVKQDPRHAVPVLTLTGDPSTTTWTPRCDLLESGANDPCFVAEVDDAGKTHLRFGDGNLGRMPDVGATFQANYGTGSGTAGNIGAESIRYIVFRQTLVSGVNLLPRNPLAATGGIDPESVAEVKYFAPYAFRSVMDRAITADDYAALASDNNRRLAERPTTLCTAPFEPLQDSKATLRWNGSWYTALVALDPDGEEDSPPELLKEVTVYLEAYRRIGHDLLVAQADYISLDVALIVCVLPAYLRAHVETALLGVFRAFFAPDNLTFGEGIYVSKIVAAAQAVAGVQNVEVTLLRPWNLTSPPPGVVEVPSSGVLELGSLEIARLDNDPNFPENGRLTLDLRGGR